MQALTLIGYWRWERDPALPDPSDFVDKAWDHQERSLVASYLESGRLFRRFGGFSTCRICGERNGAKEYTDGTFLWPEGLAHYVREHSVRLPARVVDHIVQKADEDFDQQIVDEVWWRSMTREDVSRTEADDLGIVTALGTALFRAFDLVDGWTPAARSDWLESISQVMADLDGGWGEHAEHASRFLVQDLKDRWGISIDWGLGRLTRMTESAQEALIRLREVRS